MVQRSWGLAVVFALSACTSDDKGDSGTPTPAVNDPTDDVAALIIRQLSAGVDEATFTSARDAYVAQLEAQPGIGTDREFEAFLDFSTFGPPDPAVFIGFTQGDSLKEFSAAADAAGATAEAATFFGTFDIVSFGLLTPLEAGTPVDIAAIAPDQPLVLEVAVRDFSTYPDFDQATYEQARDAFLPLLGAQPGVLGEFQWISPADPNLAVGMTVYSDQSSYVAAATDKTLTSSPEYAAFVAGYPLAAGFAATVVK